MSLHVCFFCMNAFLCFCHAVLFVRSLSCCCISGTRLAGFEMDLEKDKAGRNRLQNYVLLPLYLTLSLRQELMDPAIH